MPLTPDLAARVAEFTPGNPSWGASPQVRVRGFPTLIQTRDAALVPATCACHLHPQVAAASACGSHRAHVVAGPGGTRVGLTSAGIAYGQAPAPASSGGGWGGGKSLAQKLAEKEKRIQSEAAAAAIRARQAPAPSKAARSHTEAAAASADAGKAPAEVAHASVAAAAKPGAGVAALAAQVSPASDEPQGAAATAPGEKKKRRSRGGQKAKAAAAASEAAGAPGVRKEGVRRGPQSAVAANEAAAAAVSSPAGASRHAGPHLNVAPSAGGAAGAQAGDGQSLAARRCGERDWGVTLDVLADEDHTPQEEETRRRTRRNMRGFPEGPPSVGHVRPATLLRQNSTVDLADFDAKEPQWWYHLPSAVTWMIPSVRLSHEPQELLQGFAAFAAAAEAADSDGEEDSSSRKGASASPAAEGAPVQAPTLDDFELLRLVGAGGFGKVYQCRKKSSGRIMALKAMRKHLVIEELNVEGTRNERSVLETIQHPFIVRLHCAFHDTGRLYLLMDWHNGGHLLRLLQAQILKSAL